MCSTARKLGMASIRSLRSTDICLPCEGVGSLARQNCHSEESAWGGWGCGYFRASLVYDYSQTPRGRFILSVAEGLEVTCYGDF